MADFVYLKGAVFLAVKFASGVFWAVDIIEGRRQEWSVTLF